MKPLCTKKWTNVTEEVMEPGTIIHRGMPSAKCAEFMVVGPKTRNEMFSKNYWTIVELGDPRKDAYGSPMARPPFTGLVAHLYEDVVGSFHLPVA